MDIVFVVLGLSIALLFMFKIKWLFSFNLPFWVLIVYCILLFGLSYILRDLNYVNDKMLNILKVPIFSFVIFKIFQIIFVKMFGRNPENTFWVSEKKSLQDIIFSMLFWIIGVGGSIFLVSLLF